MGKTLGDVELASCFPPRESHPPICRRWRCEGGSPRPRRRPRPTPPAPACPGCAASGNAVPAERPGCFCSGYPVQRGRSMPAAANSLLVIGFHKIAPVVAEHGRLHDHHAGDLGGDEIKLAHFAFFLPGPLCKAAPFAFSGFRARLPLGPPRRTGFLRLHAVVMAYCVQNTTFFDLLQLYPAFESPRQGKIQQKRQGRPARLTAHRKTSLPMGRVSPPVPSRRWGRDSCPPAAPPGAGGWPGRSRRGSPPPGPPPVRRPAAGPRRQSGAAPDRRSAP